MFDKCHETRYKNIQVIKSFLDKDTEDLYGTGKSRRLPP